MASVSRPKVLFLRAFGSDGGLETAEREVELDRMPAMLRRLGGRGYCIEEARLIYGGSDVDLDTDTDFDADFDGEAVEPRR